MLAGTASRGPFAIPLTDITCPTVTAMVFVTAVVGTSTEKIDTKYLMIFHVFGF